MEDTQTEGGDATEGTASGSRRSAEVDSGKGSPYIRWTMCHVGLSVTNFDT